MKGMKLSDLLIDAFNQLDVYYCNSQESTKGNNIKPDVTANFLGLKASLGADISGNSKSSNQRAVKLPITPQSLATFFGEARACWVIEDFHKMHIDG